MSIADIIVFSVIVIVLFFVIRNIVKGKGGCGCGCSGGCSKCGSGSSCNCGTTANTPKDTK